jgi:HEAT repeat protein
MLEDDAAFPEKLLMAIHHPEPTRACLAIELLGRLHEPRAVAPLLEVLATTRDPVRQAEAALSLGAIGDGRAVPALVQLLHNPEAPFMARCAAATALGNFPEEQALAALRRAVSDPRPSVARAAQRALQRTALMDEQR